MRYLHTITPICIHHPHLSSKEISNMFPVIYIGSTAFAFFACCELLCGLTFHVQKIQDAMTLVLLLTIVANRIDSCFSIGCEINTSKASHLP